MDKIINKIYTDPKNAGSYAGADALIRAVKLSHPDIPSKDIKHFLEGNRTYTLFKPKRTNFTRLKTIPYGFLSGIIFIYGFDLFLFIDMQADLADFQTLSTHNKGNKYLLLAVDVLSRRFFGVPVKSKRPADMIDAFDELFKQLPKDEDKSFRLPKRLYTDRGLEFESGRIKKYFEEKGIEKLAATSVKKAAVAERGIRTLKTRLYRWFSENNRLDWTNVLPSFLEAINNSPSRPLNGMTPNQIDQKNAREIWKKIYGSGEDNIRKRKLLKEGDKVRISKGNQIFRKGYFPTHSDHIYTVQRTHNTRPEHYEIAEHDGTKVKRIFYRPELQKTREDAQTSYRVEKVLRRRKKGKEMELLVKFIGYPEHHWIKQSDIVN